MTKAYIVLFFAFLVQSNCFAQISPPGMGKANTAAWMAIGIKQNINQKETLESTTFVGLGTISDPNNLNIFEKKSIYVINEEITYRFKPHWNYSLAASYRWQNKYRSNKPYYLDSPYARQEIRVYSRFTYENKFKNINYT